MWLLALMGALAFFAFYLVGKVLRQKPRIRDAGRTDPLAHHIEEQIVLVVGDKLDLDPDALSSTLRDAPDAEIVAAIEKAVDRVELIFEKKPGAGAHRIDLSVEILFVDGTLDRRVNEVNPGWVRPAIAAELHRSGAARVHERWRFPWQK